MIKNGDLTIDNCINKLIDKPIQLSLWFKEYMETELIDELELAKRLNITKDWVIGRLSLLNIESKKMRKDIDDGYLALSVAYLLAQLDSKDQDYYYRSAIIDKNLDPISFRNLLRKDGKL